ncbi:hypothetical protein PRIPAC_85974 [Pristionchus pacificus]|uniref:HLH domain-containing protein n=1 Tax=Pristionchus pacificus TaxID=54126 RepID=A0A2A6BTM5_PRIPA|nr:hypothetical protein PRIPAC_85974 [Pristionchus pacificus]|eukprot:PDM69250.1 HLH domain-containing protein [Pristionchus pacificus]
MLPRRTHACDLLPADVYDQLQCSGSCNVFCCNCDYCGWPDPCPISRTDPFGYRLKRRVCNHSQAQLRFTSIDTDGDGLITEKEGRDFMMNGTSSAGVKRAIGNEWFAEIDTNGDGFIQPGEFDYSVA